MDQAAAGVNDPEAQAVAIRRRERRFPFEFINAILALICLTSAAIAVYRLQRPEDSHPQELFTMGIHAKVKNVSAGMVYVESDSNWRVQNGVIHAPCDGLYLIYAHLQWQGGSPAHAIIEKRSESHDAKWPLGRMDSNHRLVTMSELRKGETIYLKLNQSDITSAADGILGIVLLNAEPNMKTCQENMYLTEERKPNLGRH